MAKFPLFPRKKQTDLSREPFGENSGLLITLSDLTLLLLCGVVIWHVVDKQEALRQYALGPTPPISALPPLPPDVSMEVSSEAPSEETSLAPTFQQEDTIRTSSLVPVVNESLGRWEILKKEMDESIAASGLDDRVFIATTHNDLSIALKELVLFSPGKADLSAKVLPILEKVAALASKNPDLVLEVIGHTDDIPIATEEFPSNWELSTARATRVARGLVGVGVAANRISAQGYASFRPLVANTSNENRATNRRVEIRLYRKGTDENDANP